MVFPFQAILKGSMWSDARHKATLHWLETNIHNDNYRCFPDTSRLVWFKNEQDRNLFLLVHDKHFIPYTRDMKAKKLILNDH